MVVIGFQVLDAGVITGGSAVVTVLIFLLLLSGFGVQCFNSRHGVLNGYYMYLKLLFLWPLKDRSGLKLYDYYS